MLQSMHRLVHAANGSPYLAARGEPMSFGYNSVLGANAGRRDSLFEAAESTESPASYTYPEPPTLPQYTGLPAAALSSPNRMTHSTPSRPYTPDRKDQDTSKLKGVLWPGMDIFDSATPSARRRRNQKKDASILEQLEASSLEVQPTEAIWLPDGGLKKERVITGDVASSSSPWKSSPPRSDEDRRPLAELPIRRPNFGRRRGQLGGRPYNTFADDAAEQRLNFSAIGKRKRTFPVYKDHDSDPEDDDEAEPRASLTRPAPMTYLTRGLGKENEQQGSVKQEQNPFAARFSENAFERLNHPGDDVHQYRSAAYMEDYNAQGYTSSNNLLRLADVAATSTPFQTNTNMPSAYHNTPPNPYGVGYNSRFMHPAQMSDFQQQYQYQMHNQHPALHASSHLRSASATAGPVHSRSLSSGLHPLGMPPHHPFGAYGYGHGHSLQSMDQPSMFSSNNEMWAFGANGGLFEHGNHGASGSAFDQPTPAPLSEPLDLSPIGLHNAEDNPPSPAINKVDDEVMASRHSEDHALPKDDALSDRPSCGQPEESEDEGRTITAPGTPFA
ncbi:hypothetical protein FKW77_005433 [Venturia effusa]|uniref:Uncharacterized protein n=1 Tax=Venturia effusa TaxID=50376 RepID=A0A517LAX1_9PEZI|nr:hypothetical protein FKW77_005433 [Venturia effusa]